MPPETIKEHNDAMDKVFGKGPGPGKSFSREEFEPVATEIFQIPKIFRDMLFTRIESLQGSKGLPQVNGKPSVNR